MDDSIAAWMGTDRQLDLFINFLNKLDPDIKFTTEKEGNKQIL